LLRKRYSDKRNKINQKLKTHKGAAKRFKVTGTGKIIRHHSFARHILTSKSAKRKRKLGKSIVITDADTPAVRKMLPYA
jgi:large subunit ribosomal protein L35